MKSHNKKVKNKWALKKNFSLTAYCEALAVDLSIPTSLSKRVTGYIRARRYDLLKELIDTHGDPNLHADRDTYMRYAYYFGAFRKIALPGLDTESPAFKKYMEAEDLCRVTNSKVAKLWMTPYWGTILARAQSLVSEIVGMPDFDAIFSRAKHGPGVSVDLPSGSGTTEFYKWRNGEYGVSDDAHSYLVAAIANDVRAIGKVASGCNESRLAFVPKSMVVDRSINVEPRGNTYLQLGCGDVLAHRFLKHTGLSIWDQTLNQTMAKIGSRTGVFATLDLSSASDTIATELVRYLFMGSVGSLNWYHLLDALRMKRVSYKGTIIPLQKFASMGNGFVFPLQCIIYYALVRSTLDVQGIPGIFSVYGDDIIIPTEAYHPVSTTLETFGFIVNGEKSYYEGPFRESCGADFWDGYDVRPHFLREIPTRPWDVYVALNNIQHAKLYMPRAWSYLHSLLKREHCIYGPADPEVMDKWIHLSMQDLREGGHVTNQSKLGRNLQTLTHRALTRKPVDFRIGLDSDVDEELMFNLKLNEHTQDISRPYAVNQRRVWRPSISRRTLRIGVPSIWGHVPE